MSTGKFYRLLADPSATSRWYLKAPMDPSGNEVDPRTFTQGVVVRSFPPLIIPLRRSGEAVDFNFCDFDMIVTPAKLNAKLNELVGPAVQRIPATVNARGDQFEILNVCELVDCIDEAKSEFSKWMKTDGRPDKVGEFRMILKLRIDPTAAAGHHIFRVGGWPIALVASEQVKNLFEANRVTGLKYDLVVDNSGHARADSVASE